MAPARPVRQPGTIAPFAALVATAAAAAGCYYGWPGLAALPIGLLAGAWMEPPAILTGRGAGRSRLPVPANRTELNAQRRYELWSSMRWRVLIPNTDWLPGHPVLAAWIVGLVAAAAATQIPTLEPWGRAANAAAAFLTVTALTGAHRRTVAGDCPGVRVNSLPQVYAGSRRRAVAWAAVTAIGAAGAVVAAGRLPEVVDRRVGYPLAALVGAAVAAAYPWQRAALSRWRDVVAGRAEWDPRWEHLKHDPAPLLVDCEHRRDGASIYTFDAPPGTGAELYYSLAPKIIPTMGAGGRLAVLEVPNVGPNGPELGTRHPVRFEIVVWRNDPPALTDPAISTETAALVARCAAVWALDEVGYGRPALVDLDRISSPESPQVAWVSRWTFPKGPSWNTLRLEGMAGALSQEFQCEFLIDHRADVAYFGALTSDDVDFEDPAMRETLANIADEDHWNSVWGFALKSTVNPPRPQYGPGTCETRKLGSVEVHKLAFLVRVGLDPTDMFGHEPKLATALGARFVAITGWDGRIDRPGERHESALTVYWAQQPVPKNPENLYGPAAEWIIAGRINEMFESARLARPEIIKAEPYTTSAAPRHVWRVKLRLHGGVTLGDVRKKATKLQSTAGVSWLRVAEDGDGCEIYMGADPTRMLETDDFVDPATVIPQLAGEDWAQAWLDANVVGAGGRVPGLEHVEWLPYNPDVQALTFALPSGLDLFAVRMALGKLAAATGNEYLEVRPGDDAAHFVLLACPHNPLPDRVPTDFDAVDKSTDGLPFATGVDGVPIKFQPDSSPHVLLAGTTGSGKSALAQQVIYGALVAGWECYLIDPEKGGADFAFAQDRCHGVAATVHDAAATMRHVYAEVKRRKDLNAAAGVGSFRDLPDPPHRIVVFIDEFTSLMGTMRVPPVTDDPVVDAERENVIAENNARVEIAMLAGRVAREARSAGVVLVLATQKLTAKMLENIPGNAADIRTNLARVLLGRTNSGERYAALRSPDDAPPLGNTIPAGRGVWEPLTSGAAVIQVWYSHQDVLREELVARVPAVAAQDRLQADTDDQVIDLGELDLSDLLDIDLGDPATEHAGGEHGDPEMVPADDGPRGFSGSRPVPAAPDDDAFTLAGSVTDTEPSAIHDDTGTERFPAPALPAWARAVSDSSDPFT